MKGSASHKNCSAKMSCSYSKSDGIIIFDSGQVVSCKGVEDIFLQGC